MSKKPSAFAEFDIGDTTQAHGDDNVVEMFPQTFDHCPKNPETGQHTYSKNYYNFGRCKNCHEPSGLDR